MSIAIGHVSRFTSQNRSMNMDSQTIRSFIAIELPPAVRALLMTIQEELRESLGGTAGAIKWVRPEGIHLTLQFLGDVRQGQIGEITQGIERACAGVGPFSLKLHRLGVFPNPRRPRIVWVGLDGTPHDVNRLNKLQSAITAQIEPLDFMPDNSFKPHLTLGRVRDTASSRELQDIANAFMDPDSQPMFETTFELRSVSLMKSDLHPSGAVYTQIAHVELGSEA